MFKEGLKHLFLDATRNCKRVLFSLWRLLCLWYVPILISAVLITYFLLQTVTISICIKKYPEIYPQVKIPKGRSALLFSNEIESVLHERRKNQREVLEHYRLPKEKNSTRSFFDFIPEVGGQPIRSLIVTTWGTGSVALSEILNTVPETFYHFNPVGDFSLRTFRDPPQSLIAYQRIKQLFSCNFNETISAKLRRNPLMTYTTEEFKEFNRNLWNLCEETYHLCQDHTLFDKYCGIFPHQLMKTENIPLEVVKSILEENRFGLKVLLLVRDPRAVMIQRKANNICGNHADCLDPSYLCSDMLADYASAIRFRRLFPNNFKVIRYEEFINDVESSSKSLIDFFGWTIKKRGNSTDYDLESFGQEIERLETVWRHNMSFEAVKMVQDNCGMAMDIWGYNIVANKKQMETLNLVSRYEID